MAAKRTTSPSTQLIGTSHVIRDEGDPDPQRRYKALFSDAAHLNRHPGFSSDGFEWTFPDVLPIPSQDTSQLAHDKGDANRYLATVKHRTQWGRSAWLVESADFVNWTDPKLVMHSDEIPPAPILYSPIRPV